MCGTFAFFPAYPCKVVTDRHEQKMIIWGVHTGLGYTPVGQSTGGHIGRNKTRYQVSTRFYWPGMTEDVANMVRKCQKCQKAKNTVLEKSGATLHPVAVPNMFWCQVLVLLFSKQTRVKKLT